MMEVDRPSRGIIDALRKVSSATAWGVLRPYERGLLMERVQALTPEAHIVGPAITIDYVDYRADLAEEASRRSNPVWDAWEAIRPGDVVVAAARGRSDAGVFGDCIVTGYKARGAAGIVTDGGMRDTPYIRRLDIPVFAARATPTASPIGLIPWELNKPVSCGNVHVRPGDIIIGDLDGVMVVPKEMAKEVAEKGVEEELMEEVSRKLLQEGRPLREAYPPRKEWVDQYKLRERMPRL